MRIYKTLMNKTFIYLLIAVLAACKSTPYSDETTKSDLRAPAYPLLTLHPHVKLWSMTDELNKQNMTFGGSTQLPFVGFLRTASSGNLPISHVLLPAHQEYLTLPFR